MHLHTQSPPHPPLFPPSLNALASTWGPSITSLPLGPLTPPLLSSPLQMWWGPSISYPLFPFPLPPSLTPPSPSHSPLPPQCPCPLRGGGHLVSHTPHSPCIQLQNTVLYMAPKYNSIYSSRIWLHLWCHVWHQYMASYTASINTAPYTAPYMAPIYGASSISCCDHPVFRWFKFTLKPPYTVASGNLLSAIWDTSHWTSFVKFGLKTARDISYDIL